MHDRTGGLAEMTESDIRERPAFQSLDIAMQSDEPQVSRLAIAALFIGFISLLAAFSLILLPLALMGIAFSVVVVWRVARNESVSGLLLAQIGLGLAVVATVWSVTASSARERYLYAQAGEFAEHFLELLAAGKKYEALELRLPEGERQITGTNLEQYYAARTGEEADDAQMFLESGATLSVIDSGPDAAWEFSRGVEIAGSRNHLSVTVELINQAAGGESKPVQVVLRRQLGLLSDASRTDVTAFWSVQEVKW